MNSETRFARWAIRIGTLIAAGVWVWFAFYMAGKPPDPRFIDGLARGGWAARYTHLLIVSWWVASILFTYTLLVFGFRWANGVGQPASKECEG